MNDTSSMQDKLVARVNEMRKADERIQLLVEKIMEKMGVKSYEELLDQVMSTLPESENRETREMLEEMKTLSIDLTSAMSAVGIIVAISASGTAIVKLVQVVKSGALLTRVRMTLNAVQRAFTGGAHALEEATTMLQSAGKAASALSKSFEATKTLGKITRGIKVAGKALTAIGIIADVTMVIVSAVEGDKQRQELQKGIDENLERRVVVSYLADLASAALGMSGRLEAILSLQDFKSKENAPEGFLQSAMDHLIAGIAEEEEKIWEEKSYETSHQAWETQDIERESYTSEDPSLADIIANLEAESDLAWKDVAQTSMTHQTIYQTIYLEPNDVKYIETLCTVPVTIRYDVKAEKAGTQFIGCFTFNKLRDSNSDALTWFLSTYSSTFTFRLNLHARYANSTMHRSGFHLPIDAAVTVECTISPTQASYSVNGEDYATATYRSDEVPQKGYFAFNTYGNSKATVSNLTITMN